jgi:ribosomal-protein-alanine N-acetyltransferase
MSALDALCFGPEAWSPAQLSGSLHLTTTEGVGYFEGPKLLGFYLVQKVDQEIEILTIGVDPAYRRQGLGKAMIEEIIRRGCCVFLDVAKDNDPARRLYETCGFTLYGVRPSYYDRKTERVDALNYRYLVNR